MSNTVESQTARSGAAKGIAAWFTRPRLIAAGIALGGMILGSFVGIGVQMGVESTGLLGPSVDALIQEQDANFKIMSARLAELQNQSSDPEVKKSLSELGQLLARQGELQSQANTELSYLGSQIAGLKQAALDEQGFAGGADFWLKTGESVSVGDRSNVFGLVRDWGNVIDVNLNGSKKRMDVGDTMQTESCTVFFKQAVKRNDGRVGFDVSCG
ncbi:MAG TPA: hypothetical protein PKH39_02670 [Woeseiaceae bacterium]|nr:hypothetical protein [Woeseiaceae bacterium]